MVRRIVAGNWKMNTTPAEAQALMARIAAMSHSLPEGVELIVCPPYTHLSPMADSLPARVALGAQDCSAHAKGAYTGEVSAAMLRCVGAQYVILGHSERRSYHLEDDPMLLEKACRAHEAGLRIIFCVGEPLDVRDKGEEHAWRHVQNQLGILRQIPRECWTTLILAYEPIWAIGTGRTPTPEQAGAMCQLIEHALRQLAGMDIPVLYGGSCNAANAAALFGQAGISGGLIGGASLKAEEFMAIANAF